jgi:hypothetical protein
LRIFRNDMKELAPFCVRHQRCAACGFHGALPVTLSG